MKSIKNLSPDFAQRVGHAFDLETKQNKKKKKKKKKNQHSLVSYNVFCFHLPN